METPSMVLKKFHTTNSSGKGIDFAHRDVKIKSKLSRSKSAKLYSFVENERNKKSHG